jgi:DNA replication protein DnaC
MAPLAEQLAALGLRYSATHLDDVVALATKRRWSPTQLLEHLVECEHQERTRRNLERRLARSRLGRFTPMSDFDWAWPKRIDRAAVDAVLRLEFLAEARNVVLVAAQGLGKTMIAQNIAHAAVLAGTHVLFTTAAQLLLDLGSQESTRALARRLNHYATRGLLVIDEVGYLSYDARAADLLFQVITRRYEKRSLVLTTNLSFSDWPTIFPNAGSAIALIDRLVHHAEIITIEGDSYRRRVAEAKRKPPRPEADSSKTASLNSRVSSCRATPGQKPLRSRSWRSIRASGADRARGAAPGESSTGSSAARGRAHPREHAQSPLPAQCRHGRGRLAADVCPGTGAVLGVVSHDLGPHPGGHAGRLPGGASAVGRSPGAPLPHCVRLSARLLYGSPAAGQLQAAGARRKDLWAGPNPGGRGSAGDRALRLGLSGRRQRPSLSPDPVRGFARQSKPAP